MNAEIKPGLWDSSVMRLNVDNEALLSNIRQNIKVPLPQLKCHPENTEQKVAIVGGGWSLEDTYEELRQLYFDGVKLVAVNGSARWLMERNLRPSMHILLDARPQNLEFVKEPIPRCKYFLASQVHPSLVGECLDRDLSMFHVVGDSSVEEKAILNKHYFGRWQPVPSAGTVGITAIMLIRLLGFRFQHLFGMDSCYSPKGKHHAYAQALNDDEGSALFRAGDREFLCSAWQASQAQNFADVIRVNGALLELAVHGDGLLKHLLETGELLKPADAKEN